MRDAPEQGHHRDDHERCRVGRDGRGERLEEPPDPGAEQAADDHARPEDAARAAGPDR